MNQCNHVFVCPSTFGCGYLCLFTCTYLYRCLPQVNKAVIAVPAKFNAEQRKATAEAFKNAGLKVIIIIIIIASNYPLYS